MPRGKFIVFEGIDGSGKSTQLDLLKSHLKHLGLNVYVTTEPSSREIGQLIRRILKKEIIVSEETLAALFVADRLDHIQNEDDGMLQYLEEGYYVLSDRYYWSSFAYHGLHIPINKVVEMNDICHQLLKPDLTVYLDLSAEESMNRILKRNEQLEKFEKLEFLQKIRQNYFIAFDQFNQELPIKIIDANQPIDNCFGEIMTHVNALVQNVTV